LKEDWRVTPSYKAKFGFFDHTRSISVKLATTSWLFVSFDTAGEVLEALRRCIGIVKGSRIDMEVHHASPDADRSHPP
jgi:hypothetical protein